jgi:hypothetical protein
METESTGAEDQNFVAAETGGERSADQAAGAENIVADQAAVEQLYSGVHEQFGPAGMAALDLTHEVDRPDGPEKNMRVHAALEGISVPDLQKIERTAAMAGANTEYLQWAIAYKRAEEQGLPDVHRPEMPTRPVS